MKIAIVGPEESKWSKELKALAKKEIEEIFFLYSDSIGYDCITLVSGHCPHGGVDIWAEEIADKLEIKKEIYPAEVNQFEDRFTTEMENPYLPAKKLMGYKSRNIKIAETCDILYCIVPSISRIFNGICYHCKKDGHPNNGGCWTMKYTKKLGKETYLVVIQ